MRTTITALIAFAAVGSANAAGGHFDVDDATMLVPGHCQVESWLARLPAVSATNYHVGPACRVGPVEIGLNIDHPTTETDSATSAGPQLKWVIDPVASRLSAGLVWAVAFQRHASPGHTVYAVITWFAGESLQLHANAGADWAPGASRTPRWGASAEWAANDAWTVLVERTRFAGRSTERAGLRFNVNAATSVDMSAAQVGAGAGRAYVVGLNHEFAR